jgi:hypothetical protein
MVVSGMKGNGAQSAETESIRTLMSQKERKEREGERERGREGERQRD